MEMEWWERDEVNLVAATLDGTSLGSFAICCKAVHANLRSVDTLRWLTSLRGLDPRAGICSIAHIEIAEVMATCSSSIHFGWGSMSVVPSALPSLRKLAVLLQKHRGLTLSIEAHCGLEARYAMPLPGQAREFTRNRAEAVKEALEEQAAKANVPLDEERVVVRAWGCSRPMVWCFGQKGMDEPYDPVGAAKNRRVELYLRSSGFEVRGCALTARHSHLGRLQRRQVTPIPRHASRFHGGVSAPRFRGHLASRRSRICPRPPPRMPRARRGRRRGRRRRQAARSPRRAA